MASQGLHNTVKAGKVDLRFELQGYLFGTVYSGRWVGFRVKKCLILRRLKGLHMYTYWFRCNYIWSNFKAYGKDAKMGGSRH